MKTQAATQKNRPCQCPKCKRKAADKSPFCSYHADKGCPIASPLSGYEPPYEPEVWNTDKAIQYSHNCFAYASNYIDKAKVESCRNTIGCDVGFHVPGKDKGHPGFRQKEKRQHNYMTCSDVVGRTLASLGGVVVDFEAACPPMMSKIALVVDDKNDLHYYRQDANGWWSHKPGGRAVTDKDAAGVRIYCPERAVRTYPKENASDTGLDYRHFCCYMAIPRAGPGAKAIQLAGRRPRKTRRLRKGSL
jgi:hypothetical protein